MLLGSDQGAVNPQSGPECKAQKWWICCSFCEVGCRKATSCFVCVGAALAEHSTAQGAMLSSSEEIFLRLCWAFLLRGIVKM